MTENGQHARHDLTDRAREAFKNALVHKETEDGRYFLTVEGRDPIALPWRARAVLPLIDYAERHGLEALDEGVTVARAPSDQRRARLRVADLWNFHYRRTSGGAVRVNPGAREMLYARTYCTLLPEEFDHSCTHGPPPHDVLVWIGKKHNDAQLFEQLRELVPPKDSRGRPGGDGAALLRPDEVRREMLEQILDEGRVLRYRTADEALGCLRVLGGDGKYHRAFEQLADGSYAPTRHYDEASRSAHGPKLKLLPPSEHAGG